MPDPEAGEGRRGPACPICGKPTVHAFRPFCSGRCADADLQRWLSGRYLIPLPEDEGEAPEQAPGEGQPER